MTSLELRARVDSTSAGGAMLMSQVCAPMLVGLLVGFSVSSAGAHPTARTMGSPRPVEQTTAGKSSAAMDRAAPAIAELRRLSGFTWDQLARLCNVSRRSLHFWASGKAMTPRNEEHLQRLLAVVRTIDRGSASANRSALLAPREDGIIPLDLLASEQYEQVVALLGSGNVRRVRAPRLAAEAMAMRTPPPPEALMGALHDRVHGETGIARAAKSVRVRSGR